jgi:hypothetical protein
LGDAAWRLDGWTFLDDNDDYLSLVANLDYSWVWFGKNFYGFVEYYFNGLGKDDYQDAVLDPAITERVARGELFTLGRNYLSGHIQLELHPLFKVFVTSINNVEDPSGILQPYAAWDITQNLATDRRRQRLIRSQRHGIRRIYPARQRYPHQITG